jgi:hypothetical protein
MRSGGVHQRHVGNLHHYCGWGGNTNDSGVYSVRFILLTAIIGAAALVAWLGRFDVVAAGADQFPTAFVLDRWTGSVRVVKGAYIRTAVEPAPANPFDQFDKPLPSPP